MTTTHALHVEATRKPLGGTPGNSWWGVPPSSSNPDPISDKKM